MKTKKYREFCLFMSFFGFFNAQAMESDTKEIKKFEKMTMNNQAICFGYTKDSKTEKMIKKLENKKRKIEKVAFHNQKNFKEICFGYVDDTRYTFDNLYAVEIACYFKKILMRLQKTSFPLFSDLYSLCCCACEKECISCRSTQENLAESSNQAIKALKEITWNNRFVISKKGNLLKEAKKFIRKVIDLYINPIERNFIESDFK